MKRILLIICLSSIFVTGCGMTEEQKSCDHSWNIVGENDNVQYCNKHYTDICVITNALIIKTLYPYPDVEVTVDASCCAGSTPDKHTAALEVMKSCQINVIGE